MQARMKNPVFIIPDAMKALHALKGATEQGGVPAATLGLVELRASQINGCSVCVDMHARLMRKAGETDDRLFAVAAWRAHALLHRRRARRAGADRGGHAARPIARIPSPTRSGRRPRATTTRRRSPR